MAPFATCAPLVWLILLFVCCFCCPVLPCATDVNEPNPPAFLRERLADFQFLFIYFIFYFVLPGGAQPVRALNSENKRFLRLAGVATRIISCMNVHFYHPEVQIQACGLVRNLGPWDVSRCCLRRKASA